MRSYQCQDIIEKLIFELKRGHSLRSTLKTIVEKERGPLVKKLNVWLKLKEEGRPTVKVVRCFKLPENISLFLLLENGLEGQAIQKNLEQLKVEVLILQKNREEQYLQTLPYVLLLPLFVFFFPALCFSFIYPFLVEFKNAFNY